MTDTHPPVPNTKLRALDPRRARIRDSHSRRSNAAPPVGISHAMGPRTAGHRRSGLRATVSGFVTGLALVTMLGPALAQDPVPRAGTVKATAMLYRAVLTDGTASMWALNGYTPGANGGSLTGSKVDAEGAVGEAKPLPVNEVLVLVGQPPRRPQIPHPRRAVLATLVGGDVLSGAMIGGDLEGEGFDLRSPSFGEITVATDRLESLVFAAGLNAGVEPRTLRLPDSEDGGDEAVFVAAARGLDRQFGVLERFSDDGIQLVPAGAGAAGGKVRLFPFRSMVGFALRAGEPRDYESNVLVCTRTGDRLYAILQSFSPTGLELGFEADRTLKIAHAEIASVTFLSGGARRYLADLQPTRIDESGFRFADDPESWFQGPVFPVRTNRNVSGGPLAVGGEHHALGFGVQSRSRLFFDVPSGVNRFMTSVGLDDSAARDGLRANAEARIRRNGRVVWSVETIDGAHAMHRPPPFEVVPGDELVLEVDFGLGMDLGDRIDWLTPVFLRTR